MQILGINFKRITKAEATAQVQEFLRGGSHQVVTPNPEILLLAQSHPEYATLLNQADLLLPDGTGLFWASFVAKRRGTPLWRFRSVIHLLCFAFDRRRWGKYLGERICGSDYFLDLCQIAQSGGHRVFFFGGGPGIAERTADLMRHQYPGLQIVGATGRNEEAMAQIQASRPEMVCVALGAPKQEFWGREILQQCPSVKLTIGLGGTFDFYAGVQRRAPALWRQLGLEWLYRLIKEPRVRARRIYNAVVRFPWAVLSK